MDTARFVESVNNTKLILTHLGKNTPSVRQDMSELDELYLTTYFCNSVQKRELAPKTPTLRASLVYWYIRKYNRNRVFDPYALGGEGLLGAILASSEYVGVNTYYPMQKCYKDIIEAYEPSAAVRVEHKGTYETIYKASGVFDMVFAHIPQWEDYCSVVSFLWKWSSENMLIVLHFGEDNVGQVETIHRLIKTLPGSIPTTQSNITYVYDTQEIMLLRRKDFQDLSGQIKLAKITSVGKRTVYTLEYSCVYLCCRDSYRRAFTGKSFIYIASSNDGVVLDFAREFKDKLTVQVTYDMNDYLTKRITNFYGATISYTSYANKGDIVSTNDPIFASCLYRVIDVCLPSPGPKRVWMELGDTVYLNCLLIKWPKTVFLICSRNNVVDLSTSLPYGPSRTSRVIVYKMIKDNKLDDFIAIYAQPNDAIIRTVNSN